MPNYTGAEMVLKLGASTLPDGYLREIEWDDASELIETTGAGITDDTFITSGIVGHQGRMLILDDATRDTIHDKVAPGSYAASVFYPHGNTATYPKAEGTIVVGSRGNTFMYKGLAVKAVTFAWSGAINWGTV